MNDADLDKLNQQIIRLIEKNKDLKGINKLGYTYVDIFRQIEFLKKSMKKSYLSNKFNIIDTGKRVPKLDKFDVFLP